MLNLARAMCDEYVVIRRKYQLLNTCFQLEPDSTSLESDSRPIIELDYGGNVVEQINRGCSDLGNIVTEAAKRNKVISEAWFEVINTLYRGIFEPLSRSAAYSDKAGKDPLLEDKLLRATWYNELLVNHWHRVHKELRRVFESNLEETELAIDEISRCISELLETVGVTYRKTERGLYWVNFDSTFWVSRKPTTFAL